jgi:uncharacterized membrane protein YoaK (UPF0700 family)
MALAGFVAFALADQQVSGLLLRYGVDLYGVDLYRWFTASLWALVAVSAAAVANRRTFQSVAPRAKGTLLRFILVSSAAGVFFCVGFLATIHVDY